MAEILERLAGFTGAVELHVAVGDAGEARRRWRRSRTRTVHCDEPLNDDEAQAVLTDGNPRSLARDRGRLAIYAPLRDEGRVCGVVWAVLRDAGPDDLTLLEAFAVYLSLALQKATLHERARALEELAAIDALTGIPNRRAFDATLEREWARALRTRSAVAIGLLDVDHFKLYNDTFGHRQGDLCLQRIAQACNGHVLRVGDGFARYGGEEFAIVLPGADGVAAARVAERLRTAVTALEIPHPRTADAIVTVSVGVASIVPARGIAAHDLVEKADRALYRAKGTGRNRVVVMDGDERVAPLELPAPAALAPNNLPSPAGGLIGRDADISRILDLLSQHRTLTLVGAGGVGKTRVALDVARRILARQLDGAWFVELAALRDPALVTSALAAVLGIATDDGAATAASLINALRDKQLVLIVDNCEHVRDAVARIVGALARECAAVTVIATSREPLGIAGEATYRVPPHELPPARRTLTVEDALASPAIRLFVERARAADRAFELSTANVDAVAEICRRLDGIALAIELAAARVRVLDPARIARLLDSRFRLLGEGDRSALPHQQTLRATIDWSYELLGAPERLLFERLAVFAGGFGLEAIASVCCDGELAEDALYGALSALVDKSLIVFDAGRYRMLESMRAYARERLDASGGFDVVARRHADAYRALIERMSLEEGSAPYRTWIAPLVTELENVRAALAFTIAARGDVAGGAALAAALVETSSLGGWTEWAGWNTAALAALPVDAPPALRGRLLTRRAELATRYAAFGGTSVALDAASEACALLAADAAPRWRLEAINALAAALVDAERTDEARAAAREGLDLARDAHDFVYQASFLRRIAALTAVEDPHAAEPMFEESIALCRLMENDFGLALGYHQHAEMLVAAGRLDEAAEAVERACSIRREVGDWRNLMYALTDLAAILLALDRIGDAATALDEALDLAHTTENALGVAAAAQLVAAVALRRGERESAARLGGYSDGCFAALGARRSRILSAAAAAFDAERTVLLDRERAQRLAALGAKLTAAAAEAEARRVLAHAQLLAPTP